MPRRVLHLLGSSGHDGTGIARIIASLHSHLNAEKYEMHACFVGDDGPLVGEFKALGIPTHVIPWQHPSRDAFGLVKLLRYLRAEDFDIIHLHWGGPRLRWLAQKLTRSKLILHLHTCFDEGSQISRANIPTENAAAVIAVSKPVADVSSHPQTHIIYSGIDATESSAEHDRGVLTIGCAGRLSPVKGISFLLRATALVRERFPAARLEIAGEGFGRDRLEAEGTALGISESIGFLGWTHPLSAVMRQWSVFVQPSIDEGLPLAVIEAMFAGLPVIASRVGGLPEAVQDGVTGVLVPAADPRALAEAIMRLLEDENLRRKMGTAGRARAQQLFSAERMALQTTAVYDQVLAG